MLLGRTTFDTWESYWPQHDGGDPVSHGINVVPKYVPSTSRTDSTWQNTNFINGDVEAKIRELKAQPGRDLLLQGSGKLLRWLLEHDLVDELHLPVYPVVVGDGLRLFPLSARLVVGVAKPGYVCAVLGLVLEKVMQDPVRRDVVPLETSHAMKVFVRHWS